MKTRYRLMLMAAVALGVAVSLGLLWRSSPSEPPEVMEEAASAPPPSSPAPTPTVAAAAPRPESPPEPQAAPRDATVVALRPGDVAPEPEVANPPPQTNDELQPELPQTAQWKLEKTTHITALLGRDVERLEHERELAEARGDSGRVHQLETLLKRHHGRLVGLREELRTLTEAAAAEAAREGRPAP
ncbi:hypothetical protein HUA74_06170 [Myxococcus sp. CA051A]|uniref:hypothetical protein n=1 Tax=unclassified Myxococcus TaxID=2648731 RepID=UPI00157AFA1C|nr:MULTISPECIES: hypothetical protein [unclassified Myxococcus]NTX40945.1 hypothetical protein [Myxococcus sp. CA033]NTX60239.1 hypothetical protein [Myxococcus sp. CA051A]